LNLILIFYSLAFDNCNTCISGIGVDPVNPLNMPVPEVVNFEPVYFYLL